MDPGRRRRNHLRQAAAASLVAWLGSAFVALCWFLLGNVSLRRAVALSCLVGAALMLLGGGPLLARINMVGHGTPGSFAIGDSRFGREYEEEAVGEHITYLGVAVTVAPQLLVAALLLYE